MLTRSFLPGPCPHIKLRSCRIPPRSMPAHQAGIMVVTFAQGSLGLGRIFLGDVFGGTYALLLATLGFNTRYPGPAAQW